MEEQRRRRILLGALNVFGEKGFAGTTVQDLIEEVGISRATFYRYFPDRDGCLTALNDEVLAWLEEETRVAIASASGWPAQVRAVTESLVGLVAGDPRIARICGVEATFVSSRIRARREAGLDALGAAMRLGRSHSRRGDELPAGLEDFLVAGATALATGSVVRWHGLPPEDLGPELAELMLVPYLGAAGARKSIRGV